MQRPWTLPLFIEGMIIASVLLLCLKFLTKTTTLEKFNMQLLLFILLYTSVGVSHKQLKDEVGMAVPKNTQTRFVGITYHTHYTSLRLLFLIINHTLLIQYVKYR